MHRATVVLPQPDSPTREKVSPRLIVKLTPSSAFTATRFFPRSIRSSAGGETSKCRSRSLTSRITGHSGMRRLDRRMEPACRLCVPGSHQIGALAAAAVAHLGAARVERAPGGDPGQTRHLSVRFLDP